MRLLLLAMLVSLLARFAIAQPVANIAAEDYLDISIRIFTSAEQDADTAANAAVAATAAAANTIQATPEVRLAETRYLPMFLRYRLEASGMFGAVRVLPQIDNSAQLLIEGTISHSDGARLALDLTARDSTGRVWIDKRYEGAAVPSVSVSGDALAQDDFAWLFAEVVRDLAAAQSILTPAQRAEIRTVSLLRYGMGLVPDSFEGYLRENADGTVSILRLPATNDPLLRRIEEIREHEYLFIDVVDAEYQRFFGDIKPVYDMWRRLQREQTQSAADFRTRETTAASGYARGSYYALRENYDNYAWAKVQELHLDELKEGFANEVEPTEIALEDSLYKLTGTMEQQYREWRSILAELYALETE
jgi:hypothetical protein